MNLPITGQIFYMSTAGELHWPEESFWKMPNRRRLLYLRLAILRNQKIKEQMDKK